MKVEGFNEESRFFISASEQLGANPENVTYIELIDKGGFQEMDPYIYERMIDPNKGIFAHEGSDGKREIVVFSHEKLLDNMGAASAIMERKLKFVGFTEALLAFAKNPQLGVKQECIAALGPMNFIGVKPCNGGRRLFFIHIAIGPCVCLFKKGTKYLALQPAEESEKS